MRSRMSVLAAFSIVLGLVLAACGPPSLDSLDPASGGPHTLV